MNLSKAFALSIALSGLAIVPACQREIDDPKFSSSDFREVVFHAGWDLETRTVLQEDGSIWWSPGDEVGLFFQKWTENEEEGWYQTPRVKLSSQNTEIVPKTDFIAHTDNLFIHYGITDLDDISTFFAIYPYNDSNYFSSSRDGSLTLYYVIPTIQTAVAGSFDRNAFISIAETNDRNLLFRNLCGGIKFSVSQEGIKEVSFEYSGDSHLPHMSGQFMLEYESGVFPPTYLCSYGSSEVTVRAPGDSYFEVGKYYYAVMCPSEGDDLPLKVTYKKDDSTAIYISEGPANIKRSVFKRLYDKDAGLTFVPSKDEAVMMKNLPDYLKWISDDSENKVSTITEAYFHPSSNKVTNDNLGTDDAPVYFELDGTVVHYYTPKESFNIKNVSHGLFSGWRSLTKVDLTGVDASEATDFSFCFANTRLKSIDLSHFDISNATNMEYMFGECKHLESLDLSFFNPAHVMKMTSMFYLCRNLRELNLGSFDTRRCVDMSWMFCYCGSLQKLDLSNFDISSVRDASSMCYNIAIHRKRCFIKASDATKALMCGQDTAMPEAAMDYFITWLAPGDVFPDIVDPYPDLYKSTDYSKDMTFSCIQTATRGKGLDIVIMGDAYSDRLIDDGTYDRDLGNAIEHLFMEEPLQSLRDYFNVYIAYAVSENEVITGITAFDLVFEDLSSRITGDGSVIQDYELEIWPNLLFDIPAGRPVPYTIVIANTHRHAGCCEFYSSGSSIVYAPLGIDETDYHAIICHEFGHAVGWLADEYDEGGGTFYDTQSFIMNSTEGWWPNVDITSNPNNVKWSRFLQDGRYANQGLGVFEGGFELYSHGIWRPTENSIMNTATTGFNAPCREAVYKRIHELADDSFVYDYEQFVAFDQQAMSQQPSPALKRIRRDGIQTGRHLPPPIFIQGTPTRHCASTTTESSR